MNYELQRLAPWVDVLYSGLGRLQAEVADELNAFMGLYECDFTRNTRSDPSQGDLTYTC